MMPSADHSEPKSRETMFRKAHYSRGGNNTPADIFFK